ncbi:nuclease-related domain-containing protein [Horticoccus sp. 23ND18S-11]|uniref:nuclease-related domain-containing protein n=1 Tax=Horticoccus sp. 23ND18S-11 TaxID=3391832 RepID=UPI0039C9F4FB
MLIVARARHVYRSEADVPFTDLLLRPPGESTRIAAEALFEKAMDRLLILVGASAVFGMAVANASPSQRYNVAAFFAILLLVVTAFTAPRMLNILRAYWNYQLGFKGERLVGEQLNQLLAHGFHVFHDLPFAGYNIDHVVVGPSGVYVIETKTRRKWKTKATVHPSHKVRYDGSSLTWPSGRSDRFGLDQTLRNARSLADWLTRATGETVTCRPILTLPGWWIDRTAQNPPEVAVISAKALAPYLAAATSTALSLGQMKRIAFQLSERCRKVPGLGETG